MYSVRHSGIESVRLVAARLLAPTHVELCPVVELLPRIHVRVTTFLLLRSHAGFSISSVSFLEDKCSKFPRSDGYGFLVHDNSREKLHAAQWLNVGKHVATVTQQIFSANIDFGDLQTSCQTLRI